MNQKEGDFVSEAELRNPFGLRDNHIILIEDIPDEQKGLKCNCVCPACKEPFIAKLGNIRTHHFAHSGQGCDELRAYMVGLYMLLNEFLIDHNKLYLPPVVVAFELSPYYIINEDNIKNHIELRSESFNTGNEIILYKESRMIFDSTEIVYDSRETPQAIIGKKNGSYLAIRITPPDSVCKPGMALKYKDYTTLEIDFSYYGENIQVGNKEKLFKQLASDKSIYRWVYNSKIEKAYPIIIERSKLYYDDVQLKMKEKQKQAAIRMERQHTLMIKRQQKLAEQQKIEPTKPQIASEETFRKEEDKYISGLAEVSELFTQQTKPIHDSYGIRWAQCEKCGSIKPESHFVYYGGNNHVNLGLCDKCSKKPCD